MNVIGQAAGIEHGTVKGYRQHKYREVAATQECGCLKAVRDDKAAKKATSPKKATSAPKRARRTSTASKAWNGGMTGETPVLPPRPVTGKCPAPGCGSKTSDTGRPGPDMVRVDVPGSREPARWCCPGWCAVYGQALAEIRALPVTSPEGGDGP